MTVTNINVKSLHLKLSVPNRSKSVARNVDTQGISGNSSSTRIAFRDVAADATLAGMDRGHKDYERTARAHRVPRETEGLLAARRERNRQVIMIANATAKAITTPTSSTTVVEIGTGDESRAT